MNSILSIYKTFKDVASFDDLENFLCRELRMPKPISYPSAGSSMFNKCRILGLEFAKREIAHKYYKEGLVPTTGTKNDVVGKAEFWGRMFYAILQAGSIKPLYFITPDASDFINRTVIGDEFEDEFYKENFSEPLVLYSDTPRCLFGDVCGLSLFYNAEDNSLDCEVALISSDKNNGMIGRVFEIGELSDVLKQQILAIDESNKDELLSVLHGDTVYSIGDINGRLYDALLYAFKFIRLRRCDKTPIVIESRYKMRKIKNATQENRGALVHQQVSLTEIYRQALRTQKSEDVVALDKEGKELKAIRVCGYIRKQHYGVGNSLVKDVYIEAHESHAWKKTGLRIIKVVK